MIFYQKLNKTEAKFSYCKPLLVRVRLLCKVFARISQKFSNEIDSFGQCVDIVVQRPKWYGLHAFGPSPIDVGQFDVARNKSQMLSFIEKVVNVHQTGMENRELEIYCWTSADFVFVYSLSVDHENGICINDGQCEIGDFVASIANNCVHFLIEIG